MALNIQIIKRKDYVYSVILKGALDSDTYQQLDEELKELFMIRQKRYSWI